MLLSVIVPVYNSEKYVVKCIDSVLAQTYSDFEIIAINDGSTDQSGAILDSYSKKDSRVRVVHKKNSGVSDSRNIGIELAQGDYVTFIDSDDWIEEDYFQKVVEILDKYEPSIVFDGWKVDCNGKTRERFSASEMLFLDRDEALLKLCEKKEFGWTPFATFYKNNITQRVKFPKNVCFGEDLYYKYYSIKYAKNQIIYFPCFKYHYVVQSTSATRAYNILKKSDDLKVLEQIINNENEFIADILYYKEYVPRELNYIMLGLCDAQRSEIELVKMLKKDIISKWWRLVLSNKLSIQTFVKMFIVLLPNSLISIAGKYYKKKQGFS